MVSNHGLVRKNHLYTRDEIARLFQVHPRTISVWIANGLEPLVTGARPVYVKGHALIAYLKKRNDRHKCPLNPAELYCFRCRMGRTPEDKTITEIITGRIIGQRSSKVLIEAQCPVCGCKMKRFATQRHLEKGASEWHLEKEE